MNYLLSRARQLFAYLCILPLVGLTLACHSGAQQHPLNLIFETDMGNDVDDALALGLLYHYVSEGSINLLAITLNKEGTAPAAFVDIMNTWYGYPNIPIGIIRDGADCETDAINYAQAVVALQTPEGTPLFARTHTKATSLEEAVPLYRKILASQKDHSVTIVSVGFSTNLAALLDTPPDAFSPLTGRELVARKVRLLCTMAGCFTNPGQGEYNVIKDIPAAQHVFAHWPTPIVTSPFEVGLAIPYPGQSIASDFAWAPHHPMVEAYKAYLPMPYDRPTWDLTAVLYAVDGTYFSSSPKGTIHIDDNGITTFQPNPQGRHSYLLTNETQAETIKQYFVKQITRPPKR